MAFVVIFSLYGFAVLAFVRKSKFLSSNAARFYRLFDAFSYSCTVAVATSLLSWCLLLIASPTVSKCVAVPTIILCSFGIGVGLVVRGDQVLMIFLLLVVGIQLSNAYMYSDFAPRWPLVASPNLLRAGYALQSNPPRWRNFSRKLLFYSLMNCNRFVLFPSDDLTTFDASFEKTSNGFVGWTIVGVFVLSSEAVACSVVWMHYAPCTVPRSASSPRRSSAAVARRPRCALSPIFGRARTSSCRWVRRSCPCCNSFSLPIDVVLFHFSFVGSDGVGVRAALPHVRLS